jgi:murein peptide amidase A
MGLIISQIARVLAIVVAFVLSLFGVEVAKNSESVDYQTQTENSQFSENSNQDKSNIFEISVGSVGSTPLAIPAPVSTFTDETIDLICGEKTYVVEFLACGTEIGQSVEGKSIYSFEVSSRPGLADKLVLFVGGLHTGTEENTFDLASRMLQHFYGDPRKVPEGISLYIIPKMSPDGITSGSHNNARGVDLNRNWPTDDWRSDPYHPTYGRREGAGGESPLSEPESKALYQFVLEKSPYAIFVWHSQAGTVSGNGIDPADTLAGIYAEAAGYNQIAEWTYYETTGTFSNAMREIGFSQIDIELATRDVEFERNLKGVSAVLNAIAN